MPWAGGVFTRTNGTYSGAAVWQSDAAAAIKIRADRHDTHDQDLAQGINNTLTKDGQNSPNQNINWGGFKITNLALGTANTDAARTGQTVTAASWDAAGNVLTLTRADGNITATITGFQEALGFTPINKAGDTGIGALTLTNVLTATGIVTPAISPPSTQGFQFAWNAAAPGLGRTEYINNRGGGSGGFTWYDRSLTSDPVGTPLAALTGSGLTLGTGVLLAKITLSTSAPGALANGELYLRY